MKGYNHEFSVLADYVINGIKILLSQQIFKSNLEGFGAFSSTNLEILHIHAEKRKSTTALYSQYLNRGRKQKNDNFVLP